MFHWKLPKNNTDSINNSLLDIQEDIKWQAEQRIINPKSYYWSTQEIVHFWEYGLKDGALVI